jgi:hypothetical protein
VGVLSIAATTLGGLPDRLAAAVGVYAISLITYFALADAEGDVAAGVFLLPLAVSFALQPTSREVFKEAPTRSQLVAGTPARHAVDGALAELGPQPRVLTLVRVFPVELALDLGFAGYGALAPRVQANGYDPMAPISIRRALGEMGARGFLTEESMTPDLSRLRSWSIDAVQVPTADLATVAPEARLELTIEPGSRRVFALPFLRLKTIAVGFSGAVSGSLNVLVRLGGNREVAIGQVSTAQRRLLSPSYRADAVILEVPREGAPTRISSLRIETPESVTVQPSRLSAYLSQPGFLEIAATPQIRLFRVLGALALGRGLSPVERLLGPDPSGRLSFRSEVDQTVEVAMPFLRGWKAERVATEISGRLRVEGKAGTDIRLRYAPAGFFKGLGLAFLGVGAGLLLMFAPFLENTLIKTRGQERK